jgi:hypothetical protein
LTALLFYSLRAEGGRKKKGSLSPPCVGPLQRGETQRGRQRALTIEVDIPKRTVCQVRGKCNRLPGSDERAIVQRWAEGEGLRVVEALRA